MFGRLPSDIGKIVLVLLITALPGALLFAVLRPGNFTGFLLGMLFLLPIAAIGLLLASPFLLLLRLVGHRSWWSRLGLAVCAGTCLALALGSLTDSDAPKGAIAFFNSRAAAGVAMIGAGFGLWAGAWWCFFFRGRGRRSQRIDAAVRQEG